METEQDSIDSDTMSFEDDRSIDERNSKKKEKTSHLIELSISHSIPIKENKRLNNMTFSFAFG